MPVKPPRRRSIVRRLSERILASAAALALAAAACGGSEGGSGSTAAVESSTSSSIPDASSSLPVASSSTSSTSSSISGASSSIPATTAAEPAPAEIGGVFDFGVVAAVEGEQITFDEVSPLVVAAGDAVETDVFADALTLEITRRVLASAVLREWDYAVTEAEIEAQIKEILDETGQTEEELLTGADITSAYLRTVIAIQLMEERASSDFEADVSDPTEEELRARYETIVPSIANVCSAHILLESEAEALDALDRAQAGEDFGELAAELSTGPSGPRGGDLGCGEPAQFVAEFAAAVLDAELGAPYGPVETEFGWHVILVSERTIPSMDEVQDRLIGDTQQVVREMWIDWALGELAAADVQVAPEYGVWTAAPDQPPAITPPSP